LRSSVRGLDHPGIAEKQMHRPGGENLVPPANVIEPLFA
jgi:hypothetical protein